MYKLKLALPLLVVTIIINSNACLAETPSISAISGNAQHKGIITIGGSSFGTKPSAAPLRYDDFESGKVGNRLTVEGDGGWYTYSYANKTFAHYDDKVTRYPGTQSANQSGSSNYIGLKSSLPKVQEVYMSGWFNLETSGAPSRNVKIINMGSDTGWQTRIDTYPHTGGGGVMYARTTCAGGDYIKNWATKYNKVAVPDNKWHRIETYMNQGTANGGGYRDVWVDGVKIADISGTFVDGSCGMTYLLIGHYFSTESARSDNPKSGAGCGSYTTGAVVKYSGDGKYYTCQSSGYFNTEGSSSHPNPVVSKRFWDEIYVDKTRARVEIGDAPVWQDCVHKEVQRPTAWSATSITAKVNLGSFQAEELYLYVVDANGNVNTKGYPINATLGDFPTIKTMQVIEQ